ncbi:hypothetical protein Fmac_001322 [Flemingia macrophylla]|uniref:Uncharacterized protein n=1 Tax=Flemingia macrophylla TaxID=520843 RepID=A0ABD1NGR2_9FABA
MLKETIRSLHKRLNYYTPVYSWMPKGTPVVDNEGNLVLTSQGEPILSQSLERSRATYGPKYYYRESAPTGSFSRDADYELQGNPRLYATTRKWRLKSLTSSKNTDYSIGELEERFKAMVSKEELSRRFPFLTQDSSSTPLSLHQQAIEPPIYNYEVLLCRSFRFFQKFLPASISWEYSIDDSSISLTARTEVFLLLHGNNKMYPKALNTISSCASPSNQSDINNVYPNGCLKVIKAYLLVKDNLKTKQ